MESGSLYICDHCCLHSAAVSWSLTNTVLAAPNFFFPWGLVGFLLSPAPGPGSLVARTSVSFSPSTVIVSTLAAKQATFFLGFSSLAAVSLDSMIFSFSLDEFFSGDFDFVKSL